MVQKLVKQQKIAKRWSWETRAERIFNKKTSDSKIHLYHQKEGIGNCNYYCLTTNKKFLRGEKFALNNQQKNGINQIMINVFRLVESFLRKYMTKWFLDDSQFYHWKTIYHRYKQDLHFKMIWNRTSKNWIKQ